MKGSRAVRTWIAVALLCAGCSVVALTVLPDAARPVAILFVIGLVVAAAQLAPVVAGNVLCARPHFADLAAGRALRFARPRFAYVIAVLALAISLSIGLDGAAKSLKADVGRSVAAWTIGDLYVRPAPPGKSLHDEKFAVGTSERLRDVAGVESVGWFSYSTIELYGTRVPVWTWSADDVEDFVRFRVADGARGSRLWQQLDDGEIALSHNFARLHDVRVGDTVSLPTTTGAADLVVAAIVDDSASDAGVVITGATTYSALTGDRRPQEIELRLAPGADPAAVEEEVTALLSPEHEGLVVYDRAEIRAAFASLAGDLLDSFVIVGRLLFVVALLVGATATVTGMTTRKREFGLSRLSGADRTVVRGQLLRESLAVATSAWVIGFPMGLLLVPALLRGLASQTGVVPAVSWPWPAALACLPAAVLLALTALALATPQRRMGSLAEMFAGE
ncbi:MAG: ABC transporter permease [Ilumatobacteraceae bacterium]